MSIRVQCDACGAKMKTADSAAGKKAKCPKCGAPIVIPMPEPEPTTETAAVEDEYGLADSASGEDVWGDFDQNTAIAATAASDEGRTPCPSCGEMIVTGAAKCRFCGEVFDKSLAKIEKKQKRKKSAPGDPDNDMSTGDWVIAIICSGIGCIAGVIWMVQGKPKGKKMFLVSLCVQVFWTVVRVLIAIAAEAAP